MKTSNQQMHPLHAVSTDDAIGILIADHKRVAGLFATFHRLTDEGREKEKASVVKEICQELSVHTQIEEELFYPAAREVIDDEDQMDEAVVEHAGAKQLIAQLQEEEPGDELYDAKVTVLAEQIDHHVQEEEGSMFPKARYSGLDTLKLGEAMKARRSALLKGAIGSEPMPRDAGVRDRPKDNGFEAVPNKKRRTDLKSTAAKKKSAATKKK